MAKSARVKTREVHTPAGRGTTPRSRKGSGVLRGRPEPGPELVAFLGRLGQEIGSLREARGLTPQQLARSCGINPGRFLRMERGEVNVSVSTFLSLAERLGVLPGDLFGKISEGHRVFKRGWQERSQ